jgi:hypothetical protein
MRLITLITHTSSVCNPLVALNTQIPKTILHIEKRERDCICIHFCLDVFIRGSSK